MNAHGGELFQELVDLHPSRDIAAVVVVVAFRDEVGNGVTISDRAVVPTHVMAEQILLEAALAHIEGKGSPIL